MPWACFELTYYKISRWINGIDVALYGTDRTPPSELRMI